MKSNGEKLRELRFLIKCRKESIIRSLENARVLRDHTMMLRLQDRLEEVENFENRLNNES